MLDIEIKDTDKNKIICYEFEINDISYVTCIGFIKGPLTNDINLNQGMYNISNAFCFHFNKNTDTIVT